MAAYFFAMNATFLPRLQGACLVLGPVLFALSTFFWLPNGSYGATAAALIVISLVFWTTGLLGVLDGLRARMPVYSGLLLLVLIYGAIGGAAISARGLFEEPMHWTRQDSSAVLSAFGLASNVVYYWSAPLFPLALLGIGIGLARARSVPWWISGLICTVGVLFPLSRVPRISWLAHVVDGIIVVAFAGLAYLHTSRTFPDKRVISVTPA